MRSIAEVLAQTRSDLESGLTGSQVEESRRQFGRNALTPLPRESLWAKFLDKFEDPIIKILLAAALVSIIVDLFKFAAVVAGISLAVVAAAVVISYLRGRGDDLPLILFAAAFVLFGIGLALGHVLVEGMAVMVAVILATGVSFLSEYRSDREFEILNARKESVQAKIVRDGQIHAVPIEEVVVGDVVVLEMGDEIPADGRIVKASELLVDQSLMTGESESVRKLTRLADDVAEGPEHPGCVYRGTQVVDGTGQMLVAAVGDATYLGQIARKLAMATSPTDDEAGRIRGKLSIAKDLTPLQEKLGRLASVISRVGYVAALLIFLAQFGRGVLMGQVFWPTTGAEAIQVVGELLDYFVTMVIIIVVAVPEGLPMSVTVSLALAMQKMTRANSLVRQLVACETIGSATIICSDKTGTLTQNKMKVARVAADGVVAAPGSADWPKLDLPSVVSARRPVDAVALVAAVNSTANLDVKDGKVFTIGNTTEGALLHWLRENDVDYQTVRRRAELLYQLHFSSERKRMTSVVRIAGRMLCLVKGAPERILEQCRNRLTKDGIAPLDEAERVRILGQIAAAAREAMRTLAFAIAELPEGTPTNEDELHAMGDRLEGELALAGFVAIRDPLRPDVKSAVDECRSAGIAVTMITGDNVETARAIAHEIGLVPRLDEPIDIPGAAVLTSQRFNELTDAELTAHLPSLRVVARARPLDKYRLVSLLQQRGEVVAVTGDGTNDAPALKKADVGLAMGIAGTEVAKEASKIVLLDDSFATIVNAVHWGRSLYENIQRFLQFQLTINVSALAITFLGVLLFNVRAPFTVLQLLWINVIMDTFASIALCSEPPRHGLMRLPPKRRDENIVTYAMLRNILLTGAFFVVVMLGLMIFMRGNPDRPGMWAFDISETPEQALWDVEVAASRIALPRDALQATGDGSFRVAETVANPLIRNQPAAVAFTLFQVTLFFTIYVFFQVWNQVNCRSLSPRVSGLRGLADNPTFLAIALLTALGQIAIVTFGGAVFKVEPLDVRVWLLIVAGTASVVVFAEIMRFILRHIDVAARTDAPRTG